VTLDGLDVRPDPVPGFAAQGAIYVPWAIERGRSTLAATAEALHGRAVAA
jgi:hypothetical protein